MKIVVITFDEQFITVDVDSEQSVENLKALLKVETRVPLQQQQLIFNGNELNSSSKLSSFNVRDGELLVMKVATAAPFRVADNDLNLNPDGSCVNPGAFQQHVRRDSNMMTQLLQNDPELAQVILGNDLNKLQNLMQDRHQQRSNL